MDTPILRLIGLTDALGQADLESKVTSAALFIRANYALLLAGKLTSEQKRQFQEARDALDMYGEGSDVLLKELAGG